MSGRATLDDPLKAFRYKVFVDQIARAGFNECSGLNWKTEVVEYREGGDNATVRKSPGLTTFDDITLKRGQFVGSTAGGDDDFVTWKKEVFQVNAEGLANEFRREVDIVQYHRDGSEARRWRCYEAWPNGFKPMSDLKGDANEDSIEELTICHEGCELVT